MVTSCVVSFGFNQVNGISLVILITAKDLSRDSVAVTLEIHIAHLLIVTVSSNEK